MRLTASSGTEVPAATTVRPMTAGVTRASVARVTAPRSKSSPPPTSRRSPRTTRPNEVIMSMASYSPVTNSSMPSACGGIHAASAGGKRIRRSGGARKVVTMTIRVTALKSFASKTPLDEAHLGEDEPDFAARDHPHADDALLALEPGGGIAGGELADHGRHDEQAADQERRAIRRVERIEDPDIDRRPDRDEEERHEEVAQLRDAVLDLVGLRASWRAGARRRTPR